MNKNILFISISTIIISIIIALLFYKQIVYPTIIPMKINNTISIFGDWFAIMSANICKSGGIDVYLENPCDPWGRKHVYGPTWLYIPFVDLFKKFYFFYLPIIFNFIFIFFVISFFKFEKKFQTLFALFYIFSVSTLLAIERANNDIIIFLIVVLIARYRNIFINYFLILFATFSKFYPLCLSIIYLFKKSIKNIFFHFSFLIGLVLIFFYFQYEDLVQIFEFRNKFSSIGIYGFSFLASYKTFIKIDNFFLQILFLIPILIIYLKLFKKNFQNNEILNFFQNDVYENRLYLLSSITILTCYFVFANFIYREIFLIGLIPWILVNKNKSNETNFFDFYFHFLTAKFFISSILIFLNMNKIFEEYYLMIRLIKHGFDFYLILIVLYVFVISFFSLTKNLLRQK